MSHTRDMFRKHSAFYQARRDAANGVPGAQVPTPEKDNYKPNLESHHENDTDSRITHTQPPDYYQHDHDNFANLDPLASSVSLPDDLPSYKAAFTAEKPPPVKTLRKGHRLGDFFGAAFTGYIPKERAPAFEMFEPRRVGSMGAMPGATEVRRCTGGMSSSGKKKEKNGKKEEKKEKKGAKGEAVIVA